MAAWEAPLRALLSNDLLPPLEDPDGLLFPCFLGARLILCRFRAHPLYRNFTVSCRAVYPAADRS